MLNHMDRNPAHFTALKVGKTAPSLSYHLPNFQLTESLLLLDFLVASRTIIYVQQAFLMTWQLFSFSALAILQPNRQA